MFMMSQQPISIIGAGLGGVTLARSLLKRGIPVVLYERATSSPRHGYGITLHPTTYQPLLKVLDLDERTFKQRVSVDGVTGVINGSKLACANGVTSSSFRAHRARFEKLVSKDLDIRWEHGVEKLETTDAGTTLVLENGQRIEGQKCVVGTDGPHSTARKSLLPGMEPNVLPYVVFNGKRKVERSIFDEVYASALKDSNIIETRKNGTLLQVSVNDSTEDPVYLSWVYSRAAKGSSDKCFKPNRPTSSATDIPADFYEEVAALPDLEQPFKDIFDVQKMKKDRTLTWLMRTTEVTLPQLLESASKGVFFLGDSVHAQAILGGEGANAAIADGLELAEFIATKGIGEVAEWYTARFPIWQESLQKSKEVIEDMHVDRKSVL